MPDLHRVNKKPDWELVDTSSHNGWQRLARHTRGMVTPGNIISVCGAALSLSARSDIQKENYRSATVKLFVGRMMDIADGVVADRTGTKSPVGEAVDASIDKFLTLKIMHAMVDKQLISQREGDTVIAQQGMAVGLSAAAKLLGKEMHPSRPGKEDATAIWAFAGSTLMEKICDDAEKPVAAYAFGVLGDTAMALSRFACSPVAIRGYASDLIQ